MEKEPVKLKDSVSLKLYDKDENLILKSSSSKKRNPLLYRVLSFLLKLLLEEESSDS